MSSSFFTEQQRDLIIELTAVAAELGYSLWIVGGLTRDLLLGMRFEDKDIDFIVEGDALDFAALVQRRIGGTLQEFNKFLTAKILSPSAFPAINEVDFATSRTEIYKKPGALPTVSPANIREDLLRRDFTINALAISAGDLLGFSDPSRGETRSEIWEKIISVPGGREDIMSRTIRVLHEKSFLDDPTRIFRAARYKGRLDGRFSSSTEELMRAAVCGGALESVSEFRKLTEIKKILREHNFPKIFDVLNSLGVFESFKLFDSSRYTSLKKALVRLQKSITEDRLEEKLIADTALRVFYFYSNQECREEMFSSFGLSKKKMSLWNKDSVTQESAGEGLLFQALIK